MTSGPSSWSPSSIPTRCRWSALAFALAAVGFLVFLNRAGVYRVRPYVLTGIVLWACVHAGGLHATLAGVLLAAFIPTRPPPDYRALVAQADAILSAEAQPRRRAVPSRTLRAGAARAGRDPRSPGVARGSTAAQRGAALELPGAARFRAGECRRGVRGAKCSAAHGMLMAGIICGLTIGKPVGFHAGVVAGGESWASPRNPRPIRGPARRRRRAGRHRLHDVAVHRRPGLPGGEDFAAAKIAVFTASILSAIIGVAILWNAPRDENAS